MGLKLAATSGGSIELVPTNTASNFTATMPAGTGTVAVNGVSSNIVSGTAQASTSGTSIDFTSIPSWVKRITVMFVGVSTSGTSNIMIQIGDSGGVETTGYACNGTSLATSTIGTSNFTTGFVMGDAASFAAAATHSGWYTLTLQDLTSNAWAGFGMVAAVGQIHNKIGAGSKALSPGLLDRVRITTVGGTDTFDAGSINILYE